MIEEDANGLRFERVADIAPIKALYGAVYPDRKTDKFEWLVEQGPAGPARSYCAIDGPSDRIVGCSQIVPQHVRMGSETCLAAQLVDGMVLREFRGRRIFNRLTRVVMDDLRSRFEYVIGFPNDLSLGPCLHAGFEVLTTMSTFILPLRGHYVANRVTSNSVLRPVVRALATPTIILNRRLRRSGASVSLAHQSTPESSRGVTLASSIRLPQPVFADRTPRFLEWRLFDAPSAHYEFFDLADQSSVFGYVAVRNRRPEREIVDFVMDPDDDRMLGALVALADATARAGFDSLQLQCPPTNYFVPALRRAGFRELQKTASVIILPFTDRARALRAEDYLLTHADSDWI